MQNQPETRKNNKHNLLLLLLEREHPRLVKKQFSLSLSGSLYHLYFDLKEQKVITSAEVDILVWFPSLSKLPNIGSYIGYPNAIVLLNFKICHKIT